MKTRIVSSVIAVLLTVAAQVTAAATITVNTTADDLTGGDGQCTLREALANVNAAADTTAGDCTAGTGTGDTIDFNLTLPARARSAKIKLALGELVIERDVSIIGPTGGTLRISGAHATRVLHIMTHTAVAVSVSNLIIQDGKDFFGGGISNGGGLLNGIPARGGTVVLTNCALKRNKARSGSGGAIDNFDSGTMTLINCTLKRNKAGAGGAITNSGTMTLTNCALTRNVARTRRGSAVGGAISNGGTMTLTNCTLDRNRAGQGGGIANSIAGTMSLTNCTLTRNYARWGAGGAIGSDGAMTLTNSTISGNRAWMGRHSLGGGGIWQYPADQDPDGVGGTAIVTNTIIAGNGKARDCGGNRPISNGHNLDSDGTCFTEGGTDLVNTDPLLARLADYGGPTKTLALCSGAGLPHRRCTGASPAIDGGDDAVTGPPLDLTTDQRGLPRPSGEHVDIGAYEAQ